MYVRVYALDKIIEYCGCTKEQAIAAMSSESSTFKFVLNDPDYIYTTRGDMLVLFQSGIVPDDDDFFFINRSKNNSNEGAIYYLGIK